ncbi:MAG: hypothetical protein U0165_19935 [Polyangiaceae bacterium]
MNLSRERFDTCCCTRTALTLQVEHLRDKRHFEANAAAIAVYRVNHATALIGFWHVCEQKKTFSPSRSSAWYLNCTSNDLRQTLHASRIAPMMSAPPGTEPKRAATKLPSRAHGSHEPLR